MFLQPTGNKRYDICIKFFFLIYPSNYNKKVKTKTKTKNLISYYKPSNSKLKHQHNHTSQPTINPHIILTIYITLGQ